VTLTPWPATVSEPARSGPEFGAADTLMPPLPVPEVGPAIDSQSPPAVTAADQVHEGSLAVMVIPEGGDPPAAGTANVVGATLKVHDGGAAACVTLTV
jgi:hypothetical protein